MRISQRYLPTAVLLILLLPLCPVPDPSAFGSSALEVFIVEDHSQALPLILRKGLNNLTVLHVDAHDDLWPPPSPTQAERAKSMSRKGEFAELERLGRFHAPREKQLYGINNYLVLAHRLGLVSRVYWAYPGFGSLDRKALEKIRDELVARDPNADLAGARKLVVSPPYLKGNLSGVPLTVGTLSDFPVDNTPLLLDIDLDYFPPLYKTPVSTPWLGLLSGFSSTLFEAKGIRPALAVVAYSHDGGYFPVSLRFLGGWLAKILGTPEILRSEPPRNWVRKEEALHQEFFLQFDDAVSIYREILKADPANPDAHYSAAIGLMNQGGIDNALVSLRKAFSLDRRYILGFLDAAAIPGNAGDLESALKILKAAEEIDPRSGTVLDTLGNLHYNRGGYIDAARYYRKVVETGEDSALTHAYLGDCYRMTGQHGYAETEYETAIRLRSAQPDSFLPAVYWRRIAESREAVGKTAQALREYRDFIGRFPDAPSEDVSFVKERIEILSKRTR